MAVSRTLFRLTLALAAAGCVNPGAAQSTADHRNGSAGSVLTATPIAELDEPWAMTFLPDTRLLVSEKRGRLLVLGADGSQTAVAGVPDVDYGGQGGLGDVILHPDHADNGLVYLSYAEAGGAGTRGAAVARARLRLDASPPRLEGLSVIWRQFPKVSGRGHYGHRLAFSADGYLFVTSGERQKLEPAQDMDGNLGKIVRLTAAGEVPEDNPFSDQGGVTAQIWSLGHRNPLGLAFDGHGTLWAHEMGPAGGDEFNRIVRGANYGYPRVSEGDHYGGRPIPDHHTQPQFAAPLIAWNPVISPAGLIIYNGEAFPEWRGQAFLGGLSSRALIRLALDGGTPREAERFPMGSRIRDVEQGPRGYLWVLEDGPAGRLLKLGPGLRGLADWRDAPRRSAGGSLSPPRRSSAPGDGPWRRSRARTRG